MTAIGLETRRAIAMLADVMIPRTSAMPGAHDIALADAPLDRVLKHRPDLAPMLDALPELGPNETVEAYLTRLDTAEGRLYQALLQAVLGAYYMHPEVKRRLGYHGQQAVTLPRGGFGGEELIESMMSQSPRYRNPAS
ncbi:MAG: hypothetical protein U1E49_10385 [Hyphomicrobiaceae bacterium]